jgi:pyridoxine 5-phosphate synthase
MTRLSVNINKVALLRNSRRGNFPDLYQFAEDCERFGAQGITVHPRPDERHIRYADILVLKKKVNTELNIEGYPDERFMQMVLDVKPDQCTLVPDAAGVLTSEEGWDVPKNTELLAYVCRALKNEGIRSSVFIDPDPDQAQAAASIGADGIEIYTGEFAKAFASNLEEKQIEAHVLCAQAALKSGLYVNAGHDLNRHNLAFYLKHVPQVSEVSIGHAITADALYYGIDNTIQMYLNVIGSVR